jgi:hypothetical protein
VVLLTRRDKNDVYGREISVIGLKEAWQLTDHGCAATALYGGEMVQIPSVTILERVGDCIGVSSWRL